MIPGGGSKYIPSGDGESPTEIDKQTRFETAMVAYFCRDLLSGHRARPELGHNYPDRPETPHFTFLGRWADTQTSEHVRVTCSSDNHLLTPPSTPSNPATPGTRVSLGVVCTVPTSCGYHPPFPAQHRKLCTLCYRMIESVLGISKKASRLQSVDRFAAPHGSATYATCPRGCRYPWTDPSWRSTDLSRKKRGVQQNMS